MQFTRDELKAIHDALQQMILDGFAEDDSDPLMTAHEKVINEIERLDGFKS